MKNKVASIHKDAEVKRAMVEAKRAEQVLKAEEMAAKYRTTNTTPKKLLGCFSSRKFFGHDLGYFYFGFLRLKMDMDMDTDTDMEGELYTSNQIINQKIENDRRTIQSITSSLLSTLRMLLGQVFCRGNGDLKLLKLKFNCTDNVEGYYEGEACKDTLKKYRSFCRQSYWSWMHNDMNYIRIAEKLRSKEPRTNDGLKNCAVKVSCPSLVYLEFRATSITDFTFHDLICLQDAVIFLKIPSDHASVARYLNILNKMIEGLFNVKALKVTLPFLEFNNLADVKPETFSTSFNNLKTLRLIVGMNKWYMQSMAEPQIDRWKIPDKAILCLTHRLGTVFQLEFEIKIRNELQLVRFLLKHGQVLQEMNIEWKNNVEKFEEIIQQVINFSRASLTVAVTFCELT
ncbi:hypothetical protein ACOSQ4_003682 [Xanthoceras sorbifolium]